jgi:enterochelin esterase-like enzyme
MRSSRHDRQLMWSRRTLLTCGAAATTVATAGFVAIGPRRALYRVGLLGSPDYLVPGSGWPVEEFSLSSAAMQREVTWAVARPPVGDVEGVVICLHGRNDDHRFTFDDVHLHDVVASLGHSFAVVAVDGGADSYWHPRSNGVDPLGMIISELLPAVDALFGPDIPRAVLGWSMGGYGALLVAERAPERFRAVAAASPAMWETFDESSEGAFDDADDFARFDITDGIASLSSLTVRIDCGTDDGFVGAAKQFAASLPGVNAGQFTEGFHDASYWRSIAPHQIATIASTFEG